jgi:hypothetical protein
MTLNRRIREAIEACRPESDDLNDPDLEFLAQHLADDPESAALYHRTQDLDARIASAFHQVDVPSGLEQRLLARLESAVRSEGSSSPEHSITEHSDAEQPSTGNPAATIGGQDVDDIDVDDIDAADIDASDIDASDADAPLTHTPMGRISGLEVNAADFTAAEVADATPVEVAAHEQPSPRTWLPGQFTRRFALTAIGTAVALLIGFFLLQPGETQLTQEVVLESASAFFVGEEAIAPGQSLLESAPPEDYPISHLIAYRPRFTQWRRIHGLMGRKGVAYDLAMPDGRRASLYVLARTAAGKPRLPEDLPQEPTRNPRFTGGLTTATWTEGGRLCVLVVEGEPRQYQQLIKVGGLAHIETLDPAPRS